MNGTNIPKDIEAAKESKLKNSSLRILGLLILVLAIVESLLGSSLMSRSTLSIAGAAPHIALAIVLVALTALTVLISFRLNSVRARFLALITFVFALGGDNRRRSVLGK